MTLVQSFRGAVLGVAADDAAEGVGRLDPGVPPQLTVSPASAEEVAAVLGWAAQEGLGVLPLGTGSHVDPVSDGPYIVLETSRLTGIEEYQPADLTITAGTGTKFGVVDDALRENGQWAPFDPPRVRERSIGGFVSDAEHGPLWAGYGALKNHVLGATVVTGDGRILRLGGKVVKNVAGYDLLRPVVGGRGRLGVVTSVCLRAFPVPSHERVLMITGDNVLELLEMALAVGTAPILPASILVGGPMTTLDGRSALVLRLHGAPSTVAADQATIEAHIGSLLEVPGASPGRADLLLDELRDHGGVEPCGVEFSVLPSNLPDVVSVAADAGLNALVVDTYAGRIRIGSDRLDPHALSEVRAAAESAGGAMRVVRWAGADRPAGTPHRGAEVRLSKRLVSIFDPGGVLWPTRP
ncbi:MAG: FAD-binding oxidoreductase [Longimicrobiales bacterium]